MVNNVAERNEMTSRLEFHFGHEGRMSVFRTIVKRASKRLEGAKKYGSWWRGGTVQHQFLSDTKKQSKFQARKKSKLNATNEP